MSINYSPISPLAKKLQIKPGKRWLFYNAPDDYLAVLEPIPGVDVAFNPEGKFDGIQIFVKESKDLAAGLKVLSPLLNPDTVFWISYPKKSSGIKSDLEMMGSWDEPAKYGLNPVAAASVNGVWTAIRLKPKGQSKVSDTRNDALKKNAYGLYIDVERRQITLPPEMKSILEKSALALAFYQTLSFTNKREYVVWILTAKQEKTKAERLAKLVDKLLAKKKNPAEK